MAIYSPVLRFVWQPLLFVLPLCAKLTVESKNVANKINITFQLTIYPPSSNLTNQE